MNVYESWTLSLTAWVQDSTVSLEFLPQITPENLSPGATQRLLLKLFDASNAIMEQWQTIIQRIPTDAGYFEYERNYQGSLETLKRRISLHRLSNLPESLKTQLAEQCSSDFKRIQAEIERLSSTTSRDSHLTSRHDSEKLLAIYRAHSLLQLQSEDDSSPKSIATNQDVSKTPESKYEVTSNKRSIQFDVPERTNQGRDNARD